MVSEKFKHSDDGFKYFIGCKGDIVTPLCIILPQMTGYIKCFENGGKNMSFVIRDDDVPDEYTEIWDKTKNKLNIKLHSIPVYDEKYTQAKVQKFNGVIKVNFLGDEIPKESMNYTCTACVTIDSGMRMEKKNYPQVFIARMQIQIKENKDNQIHKH